MGVLPGQGHPRAPVPRPAAAARGGPPGARRRGRAGGGGREKLEALLQRFGEEEKRHGAEKKDIEKAAKALEHERDVNRAKDPYFDYAEVLLQIAIVMSSVSIISTPRPTFFFSLVLAVAGALLAINGFTLWVSVPFLAVSAPH